MNWYNSYGETQDTRGLYLLVNPEDVLLRDKIIAQWKRLVATDAYQIITPVLVPSKALVQSGHLSQFKDQLYKIEGHELYLRPETASSIFANYKLLRRMLKGNPLKISSLGKSFRNQKSTRTTKFRRHQFEQLELQILASPNYPFVQTYQQKLKQFFLLFGLEVQFKELSDTERPHYALRTIDIEYNHKGVVLQMGCLNYRGTHDLTQFSSTEQASLSVYQISLGLDRLLQVVLELDQ